MDEMDDKILLAAFYNGVNSDLFIHKLYNPESQTMVELIHSAQSFMNTKDIIIAKKKKKGERLDNVYTASRVGSSSKESQSRGEKGSRWQESRVILRTIL